MSARPRAGLWLAAILLWPCLPVSPALSRDVRPDVSAAQIEALQSWLDAEVPWPRRGTPPLLRLITPAEAVRLGGAPGVGHGATRGIYAPETGTIYLVRPWSAADPQDLSILLHELIHHRQAAFDFACAGAMEEPAYRAQDAWLAERGLEGDINWFAIVLAADCAPRDIHPD